MILKTKSGDVSFRTKNLKQITILALGFFWCSALCLSQQTALSSLAGKDYAGTVALLYGSLAMAAGIFLFFCFSRRAKNLKYYYLLFSSLALLSSFTFFAVNSPAVMSLCLCLTCFFGTAGFGAGYHFSLLATSTDREYRGRVFAIGYGLGSIFTYLLSLLPVDFYASLSVMLIVAPLIIANCALVYKTKNLVCVHNEITTKSYKQYFLVLSALALLASLFSAIASDVVATHLFELEGLFANTRIYYCLGLLVAGFFADKHKEIFDVCVLISLVFSLLIIILLNQNLPPLALIAPFYFFIGFFVVFRTTTFANIYDQKKSAIAFSAFGLMYSRLMEGIFAIFQSDLAQNYILLIISETVLFCIILWIFILHYNKNAHISADDKIHLFAVRYKLSAQEERILNLLMQDLTKKEIASRLFLSVNTVKIHVTNIYRKTNMRKAELKEKFTLHTT